jgi:hypothetical protein
MADFQTFFVFSDFKPLTGERRLKIVLWKKKNIAQKSKGSECGEKSVSDAKM